MSAFDRVVFHSHEHHALSACCTLITLNDDLTFERHRCAFAWRWWRRWRFPTIRLHPGKQLLLLGERYNGIQHTDGSVLVFMQPDINGVGLVLLRPDIYRQGAACNNTE